MISKSFQIILILAMSINLVTIIVLIKRENMRVKYALAWIFISICTLLLAIFPKILRFVSDKLYIYNDANALFMIALGVLYVLAFSFSVLFSNNSYSIQSLAQEVAMLRLKVEKLEKQLEDSTNKEDNEE